MLVEQTKPDLEKQCQRYLSLLQPGATLTLDMITPAGQKGKFRSVFIGYLPNKYVLVQCPENAKLGNFAQYIVQGMSVTIRGLSEGHEGAVIAFISKVKQTIQIPSRILVLKFPSEVSLQNLRSSMRIETQINAKIKIKDEYWSSIITDMSVTGCQLQLKPCNNPPELSKEQVLDIVVERYQQLKNIKFKGTICNNKKEHDSNLLGLSFDKIAEDNIVKLLQQAVVALC